MVAAAQLASLGEAHAVTANNGSLVYSPAAGTSFNPEVPGGKADGTTYPKIVALKNSGSANGQLIVTFDQLVLENGVQVYPIYRSTDGGSSWGRIAAIAPVNDFPGWNRTAQPSLFELRQQIGSMPTGTLLLAGMIMPQDRSASKLVIYKSYDHGLSWSLLSQVDQGGPAVYDPSPTSTTSTVWEPSLALDPYGNLMCFFSDERQKSSGVLQAVVYRKSTDGGSTWGPVANVVSIGNRSDRPGMITVTRMPNGKYLATYEVVNRPSQSQNNAQVYYKISDDGINWNGGDLGTPIRTRDGRGIGSSPFVTWVPSGGPNGMVVVSSKWGLNTSGNIDQGQDFMVNYNLGQGPWERLPYAVTYDAADSQGGSFSGFAQGLDFSGDGKTLYQAANVENLTTTYNDVRVGTVPLNAYNFEAELAATNHVTVVNQADASNGAKIGNINYSDSWVQFIQELAARNRGLADAVRSVLNRVRGKFAIAVVHADDPEVIVAARRGSPLVVGLDSTTGYLASDIPAIHGRAESSSSSTTTASSRSGPGRSSTDLDGNEVSSRSGRSPRTSRPPRRAATPTSC